MDELVRAHGLRQERVLASAQFRDGAFRNTHRGADLRRGTRWEVAREYLFGGQARRPPRPLPADNPLPVWARRADTGMRATWLGQSTVLLELDGIRVLTDPVWSERISPFGPAAPRRFQPVPIRVDQLPPLDAIVISHEHFDHLDHGTILALAPHAVPYITSLGVGTHLQAWGVPPERIIELDWWETARLGDLAVTATPAQHFASRGRGRNQTLWSSLVIETPRRRVFFSGDTGLTPEFAAIRARCGPFDLVMLEIGSFHPAWGDIHLGPANALEALKLLGGGALLPVHWGTFNLALHAWDEPAESMIELAAAARVELVMPRLGAPVEPARPFAVEPWWREATAEEPLVAAAR